MCVCTGCCRLLAIGALLCVGATILLAGFVVQNNLVLDVYPATQHMHATSPSQQPSHSHPQHTPLVVNKLLLFTYYRGGSTFLGEMFNQNPDVFYLFEPLISFFISHISENRHTCAICDFSTRYVFIYLFIYVFSYLFIYFLRVCK